MINLQEIWNELQAYDGNRAQNFQFTDCRVQFYKGAMEIPLVAFFPTAPFTLGAERMEKFARLLSSLGLELDCVEEGNNYKINRAEEKQYVGRITGEAIKLHAVRSKELGWETFYKIVSYFVVES